MAIGPDKRFVLRTQRMTRGEAEAAEIDVGLRAHMLRVYNYMTVGLVLTGAVAFAASTSLELMQAIHGTGLRWIVMLAPFAFILVLSFGIERMKAATAQLVFWGFAAVMGLSTSYIFLAYTGTSIVRVFFITAGVFAAMSLYGYTTKRDLSAIGSFLMMGLFGIIIAMVVNMFLESSALHFVISVIGVLVFVGLTAHDTQYIKAVYRAADHAEIREKKAINGALHLYLDFLNLFMLLLHLFGGRE